MPGLYFGWPYWHVFIKGRAAAELPTPDLLNRADVFNLNNRQGHTVPTHAGQHK
jgi:hypothetical protein